jgi:hypothetical protein
MHGRSPIMRYAWVIEDTVHGYLIYILCPKNQMQYAWAIENTNLICLLCPNQLQIRVGRLKLYLYILQKCKFMWKNALFLAMPNHHVTRKNESYAHMLTNAYEKSTSSSPKLHPRLSRNSERSKHRWKQEDIKSSVFDAITELANTIMPNSRRFSRILVSNTSLHHRIPSIKTALRNV